MDRFLFLTLDGLARGAVYAAFGLALVLIWRGTRVVNFAQGVLGVASVYVAYTVTGATGSYWWGLSAALVSGLVLGAVVERLVMRRVTRAGPLDAVIAALGLILAIQAVLGMIYGNDFLPVETPFARTALRVGGADIVSPYDLFVLGAVLVVMLLLAYLFNRTKTGLRMRAAAFAPDVARTLGVRVGLMLTVGWGLAAAVGSLAGLLATPPFLFPNVLDGVFVYALTAAVLGGLDNPLGTIAGGFVLGVGLSYVSGYFGPETVTIAALAILVIVLTLRPAGLFGRAKARRV